MKQYEFHSALPPEELKKELDRWVRVENILLDGSGKLKIKWWNSRFTLSMTKREDTTTAHLCPVRGEVFPDGNGGSFLHGEEYLPQIGHICFAIALATCIVCVFSTSDPIVRRAGMGLGTAIAIFWVLEPLKPTLNCPELEQFLTRNFEKLEDK